MRKKIFKFEQNSGVALIMSLGVLSVLLILAVTFAFNTRISQKAARNYLDYVTADIAAKSALEEAVAEIRKGDLDLTHFDLGKKHYHPDPPPDPPPEYDYVITPESGNLNLNFSGNLSVDLGAGARTQGQEAGWSTFEISIASVLEKALGIPETQAEEMAEDIIRRRYGGAYAAGASDDTYDELMRTGQSGIDHDASGSAANNNDPFWFFAWDEQGRPGHNPFTIEEFEAELEDIAWANNWLDYPQWSIWEELWEDIREYVGVGTRSTGELSRKSLNVIGAPELFTFMGLPENDFAQKAVNIINYRDPYRRLVRLPLTLDYYGIGPILINEVLARSYDERDIDHEGEPLVNTEEGITPKRFRFNGFAPNTAYRLRIHAGDVQAPGFEVRVGNESAFGDWEQVQSDDFIDYPVGDFCISSYDDGDGYLYVESRPLSPIEHDDIPPGPMTAHQTEILTVPPDYNVIYEARASGEYVVFDGEGNITEERRAWHAFNKRDPDSYFWKVESEVVEKDLPPGNMQANTWTIDGVQYVASASDYVDGYEPYRAFGSGFWESELLYDEEWLPPAMSGASQGGYTVDASSHMTPHAPYRAFDKNTSTYWEVDISDSVSGITIYDWEDLNSVRDNPAEYYVLMNDLTSATVGYGEFAAPEANEGAGWEPIGYFNNEEDFVEFSGKLYGQGHIISGLNINRPDEDYVGLFGVVGASGSVIGIKMEEAEIQGRSRVGSIAGLSRGFIYNAKALGPDATVEGSGYVGGAVGINIGTLVNVKAGMNVTGVNGAEFVGGLVGANLAGGVLHSGASGNVAGGNYVGGLVGGNQNWIEEYPGVVAMITRSFAQGSVNGTDSVGGLVGLNEGAIDNSYAMGGTEGISGVGGLVGVNETGGAIEKVYSAGAVTGDEETGGLVGSNYDDDSVGNSFWDTENSALAGSAGGTGKTEEEMKDINTYTSLQASGLGERKSGSVSVDAGSALVSGEGTLFLDELNEGEQIRIGSGDGSEVRTIISIDTNFVLEVSIEFNNEHSGENIYHIDDSDIWDFANIWDIDEITNEGYPYLTPYDATFSIHDEWIEVDMGEEQTIYSVSLDNYSRYGAARFDIRASETGTEWITIRRQALAKDISGWQNYTLQPNTYRYWRLYPTSGYDEGLLRINRIRFESREYEGWIALDLGKRQTIGELKLRNEVGYGVKDFTIQRSNDGVTWTDVSSAQAADIGLQQVFDIDPPESYRHFRLYVESIFDGEGSILGIRDIRYVTREVNEWLALDMGDTRTVHTIEIANIQGHGASDFNIRAGNSLPPAGGDVSGWGAVIYSGSAEDTNNLQSFSFAEETYSVWILEILGCHDYDGDLRIREINYIGEESILIERIEFAGPEFIELINVSGAEVDLEDWEIETAAAGRRKIGHGVLWEGDGVWFVVPGADDFIIEPGGYFVLANDMELFARSFGVNFPQDCLLVDMGNYNDPDDGSVEGWTFGVDVFEPSNLHGELGTDGGDIRLYDERGMLAELAVNDPGIANTSRPGEIPAASIGISREKNDPTVRDEWWNTIVAETGNPLRGSTPGRHNTRLSPEGADVLDDIKAGAHEGLVAHRRFGNVGEVIHIPELNYEGVRSGRQWEGITEAAFRRLASRFSTSYIRLDAERADTVPPAAQWEEVGLAELPDYYKTPMYRAGDEGNTGVFSWEEISLNPEFKYDLYIFGIYSDSPLADLKVMIDEIDPDDGTVSVAEHNVRYGTTGGAYVTSIDERHIDADDGSLAITIESLKGDVYFDYIILIPDNVPGKININVASKEVLMGLQGVDEALAQAIREYPHFPYSNTAMLLDVMTPAQFAPISNLVSDSVIGTANIFRIVATGRNLGPAGAVTAEREIEMIVSRSGSEDNYTLTIMSWKYLY